MLKKINKKKGSVLVVALFVLSIIIISTLSMTFVAIKERKASVGDVDSSKAYQLAEIGVEKTMQLVARGNYDYLNKSGGDNNLLDNLPSDIICDSSSGFLKEKNSSFIIEFFDNKDPADRIDCDDPNAFISDIFKIKSTGISLSTKRSIEAKVSNYDLIGRWKLNDHLSFPIIDYSGNKKDGVSEGNVIASHFGSCDNMYLSSSDGLIKINDWKLLNKNDSLTLSAWIAPENIHLPRRQDIVVINKTIRLSIIPNILNSKYKIAGMVEGDSFIGNTEIDHDSLAWHHIVYTINLSEGKQNIYIDGVLDNEGSFSSSEITYDSDDTIMLFGKNNDLPLSFFNCYYGYMSDIRVYSKALNENEIKMLYGDTKNYCI